MRVIAMYAFASCVMICGMSRKLPAEQDVGPPPFFTVVKQPFNYSYRQNPYTKVVHDAEGNIHVHNTTAPVKHIRHTIAPDAPARFRGNFVHDVTKATGKICVNLRLLENVDMWSMKRDL